MRSELKSCQQQCVELQQQVDFLQEQADSAVKNLESSNKALICELEDKLRREKQECHELREQLTVSGTDITAEVIKVFFCLILRNHSAQILWFNTEKCRPISIGVRQ
jgi:uncharacterized protein HemX